MVVIRSLLFLLLSLLSFSSYARGANYRNGPLVSPAKLEMFVDELPRMPTVHGYGVGDGGPVTAHLTIGMYLKTWKFHRDLPPTPVYAFGTSKATATVPGPTIESIQGVATHITWENHLPSRHILPFDRTILIANPEGGGIPTVVHLHGGVHPPAGDGNPRAWFTSGFKSKGPAFVSPTSVYPNVQEPGNLWYHDHAMGLTRVNILAGLLGSYAIRNPSVESALGLPSGPDLDRTLIVFDRSFRTDGSLFLNATGNNPSIHPQWQPEYFGDAIIVNGKAWPYLKVARRRYRFRIINASNARYFRFFFDNGLQFVHIGSDSMYLHQTVTSTNFLLAASETADVIVDFSKSTKDTAILSNNAAYPYPSGDPTDEFNGKVMKFIIDKKKAKDDTRIPKRLMRYPPPAVHRAVETRYITMYEYTSKTDEPTHFSLNNKTYEDPITEKPKSGTSEIWHVINLTDDNHPLHVHLGLFTVLDQQEILDLDEFKDCMEKKNNANACRWKEHVKRKRVQVPKYERGWKNVFKMMPGYVTRILVRFSMFGSSDAEAGYPFNATGEPGYVYHCHILDHEDNVMMRPFMLVP
ncbi:multicopper oxidase LPR2-like [Asparagus officinalis]|uniref:multicopper oxidase LPR2-like n=1 Tax=Asparagus officinalis TaxID=4686 RepID=UPI00098E430F|nr:multicopper oxidase LPR2-like [Asparagus officinalis]